MYIAIGIILLLAALFLIVAVLLQSGKDKGLSGSISGGSSDTYFGKNKGKSRDKKLATITIIVAVVFVLIVLGVFISQDYTSIWGTATNITTTVGDATTTTGA
jgi:preprotein translocase subunit SecG